MQEITDQYRTLSVNTAIEYLSNIEGVAFRLGENVKEWTISEIGTEILT